MVVLFGVFRLPLCERGMALFHSDAIGSLKMDAQEFTRKIISYLASLLASFYGLFRQPENGFSKIYSLCFHVITNYFALFWHRWHVVCNMPHKHDANAEGITAYHARGRGFESRLCRINGRVAQLVEHEYFFIPCCNVRLFRANAGWFTG